MKIKLWMVTLFFTVAVFGSLADDHSLRVLGMGGILFEVALARLELWLNTPARPSRWWGDARLPAMEINRRVRK